VTSAVVTLEALASDPHPLIADLREQRPVHYVPEMDRWLVSSRGLVLEVIGDTLRFPAEHARSLIRATFGAQMLNTDGTEQRRHRTPYAPAFRPRVLRTSFEQSIQARAQQIVASLAPGDDLTEPASVMAVSTVLDLVGLSAVVGVDTVAGWYVDLAAALANVPGDPEVAVRGKAAARAFAGAMTEADLAGEVVLGADSGLTTDEQVSNTLLVLFGGIETTQSAILNALWALATHRDAQDAVRRDRTQLAAAVEESLRWEPAVLTLTRFTTAEVVLGGVTIAPDSIVECLVAGANRDPATFEDPDRYDPTRGNVSDHLTFGWGPHFCLGAQLARMEAVALIGALLDRAPRGFWLLDPDAPGPTGHEFRHPPHLQLTGWTA